jgi:hypothetical protein
MYMPDKRNWREMPAKKKEMKKIEKKMERKMEKRSLRPKAAGSGPIGLPAVVGSVQRKKPVPPVVFSNREKCGDVSVGADFVNSAFQISPLNEELFPVLSQVANRFQVWEWEALKFEYVPDSSTNFGGDVVLSVNANPDDEPDSSLQQASDRDGAVTGAPYTSTSVNALTKAAETLGKKRYSADVTGNVQTVFDDIAQVSTGVLNVCTGLGNIFATANPAAVAARKATPGFRDAPTDPEQSGALWATYTVKLRSPRLGDDPDDGVTFFKASEAVPCLGTPFELTPSEWSPGEAANPLGLEATFLASPSTGSPFVPSEYRVRFREPGIYQVTMVGGVSDDLEAKNGYDSPSCFALATDGTATSVPSDGFRMGLQETNNGSGSVFWHGFGASAIVIITDVDTDSIVFYTKTAILNLSAGGLAWDSDSGKNGIYISRVGTPGATMLKAWARERSIKSAVRSSGWFNMRQHHRAKQMQQNMNELKLIASEMKNRKGAPVGVQAMLDALKAPSRKRVEAKVPAPQVSGAPAAAAAGAGITSEEAKQLVLSGNAIRSTVVEDSYGGGLVMVTPVTTPSGVQNVAPKVTPMVSAGWFSNSKSAPKGK